jgi:hypothetical protein
VQAGENIAGYRILSPLGAGAESFLVVPGVTQQADTLLNLVVNWPAQIVARRDGP